MNLENTLKFINELNDKVVDLQEKYDNLEKENKQLNDNLDSLTKVSYLNNINKQLKDKIAQNDLLTKQLEKASIIINTFQKIKEFNIQFDIPHVSVELEKSETVSHIAILPDENIDSPECVDNLENAEGITQNELDQTNYETIQYKKNNYLLNSETNKVYDILNDKPNNYVANFVNNKLKFI
jgi:hypothetical protein